MGFVCSIAMSHNGLKCTNAPQLFEVVACLFWACWALLPKLGPREKGLALHREEDDHSERVHKTDMGRILACAWLFVCHVDLGRVPP
jgi:hypothetical protein